MDSRPRSAFLGLWRGKTTLDKMIVRLEEPAGGTVPFKRKDVLSLKGDDLSEALLIHGMEDEEERIREVEGLLGEYIEKNMDNLGI